MDGEDTPDLSLWTAKPPPKTATAPNENGSSLQADSVSARSKRGSSAGSSEAASSAGDVNFDGSQPTTYRRSSPRNAPREPASDEDVIEVSWSSPSSHHGFIVDLPAMTEEEKAGYSFAPGHTRVSEILAETKKGIFRTRLGSDEVEEVRPSTSRRR
jgi:hypothetical protein